MERVGVLINKLQDQLAQKADVQNMLVTAQMLQAELLSLAQTTNGASLSKIAVVVPNAYSTGRIIDTTQDYKPVPKPELEPEPIPEPMPQTDAPAPDPTTPNPIPKPEPEPIPHFAEGKPWEKVFTKPWASDPVMEIPTLAHQDKIIFELNDSMVAEENSVNDKLKQEKSEVANTLQDSPIRDLKRAININDRHRFISELFRGDETMYERSIKTINGFNIFAEAEYWIQRELKVKLGWNTTAEVVKIFDQLVKRRFS